MKLAFSTPTNTDDEQRRLFEGFGPAGYDGLQLKAGQYARYRERPEAFLSEWGGFSRAASGLIWGGPLDAEGVDTLRAVLRFASAVGSERVVFCHGMPRERATDDDLRRFARLLSEIGEEAAPLDVRLSLHHHYNQPVMHRDDFDTFFGAVEHNTVGLTIDTAHLVKSGITDIGGVIRDFAPFIDNIHVKDFADGEFRVLGKGNIDFDPVFAALRDIGYDGWLCADEESGADIGEALDVGYRFLTVRHAVVP